MKSIKKTDKNLALAISDAIAKIIGVDAKGMRENLHELYKQFPPDKNLTSVDGMFLIPFVLKDWDLDEDSETFDIANKIKVAIAYKPDNVLAIAYRMGIHDEQQGKTEAQYTLRHRNVRKILKDEIGLKFDDDVKRLPFVKRLGKGK